MFINYYTYIKNNNMLYTVSTNTYKEFTIRYDGIINTFDMFFVFENIGSSEIKYKYSNDGINYGSFLDLDELKQLIVGSSELNIIKIEVNIKKEIPLDKTLFGFDVIVNGNKLQRNSVKNVRILRDSNILITNEGETKNNLYNPYRLSENQKILQNKMSRSVSDIFGHEVLWFKTTHDIDNASITFKEYNFGEAKASKPIKIVVKNNYIPDNKARFSEWDMDFQDEMEIHVDKEVFKEVFGDEIPNSDDFFWFPLTQRMYTINSPYNEKNFMQNDPFWKMTCVKYEQKSSIKRDDFVSDEINSIIDFTNNFHLEDYEDEKSDASGENILTVSDESNNISECYVSYKGNEVFRYFYNFNNTLNTEVVKRYDLSYKDEFTFLGWFRGNNNNRQLIDIDSVIKLSQLDNKYELVVNTVDIVTPTKRELTSIEIIDDEWYCIVISNSSKIGAISTVLSIVDCNMMVLESIEVSRDLVIKPESIKIFGGFGFSNIRVNKRKLTKNTPLSFKDKLVEKEPLSKENYIIDNAVPSLTEPTEFVYGGK